MEPLDQLKQMTAWDTGPELSEDNLTDLLGAAALEDEEGLDPFNEEWTPTYDFNAAAVAGWLMKAGKAAATVEVDPPDSGIVTSKVFDNCREMARIYARRRNISVSVR